MIKKNLLTIFLLNRKKVEVFLYFRVNLKHSNKFQDLISILISKFTILSMKFIASHIPTQKSQRN